MELKELKIEGYKRVVEVADDFSGLHAIVAIHNTNLGPALGGTRAVTYDTRASMLDDALNLSKGMTYKSALAGPKRGGGKSTINLHGGELTNDMLIAFGNGLNEINKDEHMYTAAGDVGTTTDHLAIVGSVTQYVAGTEGTDSGIATAYGVYMAMKGALRFLDRDPAEEQLSILGVGKVGKRLMNFAKGDMQKTYIADVDSIYAHTVRNEEVLNGYNVDVAAAQVAHWNGTIFAPCALGGVINRRSIAAIPTHTLICGGANNQIDVSEEGALASLLMAEKCAYVPDYLANAGGVIIIEARGNKFPDLEYDNLAVMPKLERLAETAYEVLSRAKQEKKFSSVIADRMAEERFNA